MTEMSDNGAHRHFYDRLYSQGYRASEFWFGGNRTRLIVLARMMKAETTSRNFPNILDIGCGNGLFSIRFAESGSRVVGIDLSLAAIKKAKHEANNKRLHDLDFLVGSAENLPFKDSSFDIVFHSEVLEHVEEPKLLVWESARVLKDGGSLVASVPCANEHSYEWWVSKIRRKLKTTKNGYLFYWDMSPKIGHPIVQRFASRQVQKWYRDCGVSLGEIQYHSHFFTPLIEYQLYRSIRPYKGSFEELTIGLPMRVIAELFDRICRLDYVLFKRFPFGSNMLIRGSKTHFA